MSNWLSNRLTPSKIKEARWVEFATVLEHVWEEFFDPGMSRLERLRSAYTAEDSDLIKKIREMGDYFSFDRPVRDDLPISLAWRRLELEYKDMELILGSVFKRHFSNLPVTWFPIFAPLNQKESPYGSHFEPAQGPWPESKNSPPEGMFLTSRGCLGTDYNYLLSLGYTKQDFLEQALPLLMRSKPLHIVYAGPLWYIKMALEFNADVSCPMLLWERDNYFPELQFHVFGSRFDYAPADIFPVDTHSAYCEWQHENYMKIAFIGNNTGLDHYFPDGVPELWLIPLDCHYPYYEADQDDLMTAIHIISRDFTLPFNSFMEYGSDKYSIDNLDHYHQFDLCPADLLPLDLAIGGNYV